MTLPDTPALRPLSLTLPDGRRLACTETGPADATDLLLCLPGILETRQSFETLLRMAPSGLRVLSVDLCGRGDADPLPGDRGYSMARYLDDLHHLIGQEGRGSRLHLLGTSMGGILAMYLASEAALQVQSLRLNDIGTSLHWSSLMALSRAMLDARADTPPARLAAQLGVSPGVLEAVQSPTHFDLPYRKNWQGMQFGELLRGFRGPIFLVRGQESVVCLSAQVHALRQQHPQARVLEVAGASHPVPLNAAVCPFLLQGLQSQDSVRAEPEPASSTDGAAHRSLWQWLRTRLTGR